MRDRIIVLPHALKHGLSEVEVAHAWKNALYSRRREGKDDPPQWIAVSILPDGRMVELIGIEDEDGNWRVFHALVPPTKKFMKELGLGRKHHGSL